MVWLGVALLLILIPAHIVWFLERRHHNGIIPTDKYIPGIFYGMYWSAATLATQAENQPRQWLARVVALFWMFTGIVFVALYTAQLAATLTVQQIQGGINGPDDLAGRKVATTRGSTAANIVRELRAQVVEVARIDEAYQALQDRDVDAVVFDSPVLLYYAANEGQGPGAYGWHAVPEGGLRHHLPARQSAAPAGQRDPAPTARRRHLSADLRQVVHQPIAVAVSVSRPTPGSAVRTARCRP